MSAAFDTVSAKILEQKLKLYGLDEMSCGWIRDYLTGRTQSVMIGASVSPVREVSTGVPQGSIMGPCLYGIFTNDLPAIIRNETCNDKEHRKRKEYLFGEFCPACGTVVNYADDYVVSVNGRNFEEAQDKLHRVLEAFKGQLNAAQLCLNPEKSKIFLSGTRQRLSGERRRGRNISILEGG